jgi:hypothetical protein
MRIFDRDPNESTKAFEAWTIYRDLGVVSLWWMEQTGLEIEELTDGGEVLGLHRLHRQTAPIVPREAT